MNIRYLHPGVRGLAAVTLLAATAACTTVGPDYKIPDTAMVNRPAAAKPFTAAAEKPFQNSAVPARWWQLYHDAQLDQLIEKAFAANTDLRVASANLARALAAHSEVEALTRPSVSIDAAPDYGRPSASANFLPEELPNSYAYDTGIKVGYQIDLFGKIKRAMEASGADTEAVRAAYDLVRINVAAETTRAYVDACASGRQIVVARHSVDLQQDFVDYTKKRVRVGRGTPLDTSRVQAQLEQLRATLPPLTALHRAAQFRLAVLTGEVPGALPDTLTKVLEACSSVPQLTAPIPVGDGAALLQRRPDIRQAERSLASASARIGVATADLYPTISLGLSAGSTGALEQFGNGNNFRWGIGPLISWTLPINGAARSRIRQAEAGSDAALARFDGTVLNAMREVETALTGYARELDRNAALKAARDQSALAARQAATIYRYGRVDFLTKLDADRVLATAESALAASDGQLAADQVGLFLALGGGWQVAGNAD